ncbi:hypothetical protein GB937_006763 [Aspergillus fischeri]|nr:hypothetical protein GB937_006763 [Aspergillus fischeri]
MSLHDMKLVFQPEAFDEDFVRGAITELLQALDFLHNQGEVDHTDLHPGNMLLGAYDSQMFEKLGKWISHLQCLANESHLLAITLPFDASQRRPYAIVLAALGPPPLEFLAKDPERKADFWDEHGNWLGLAPIPDGRTMEALESRLVNNSDFLRFIR